MVLGVLITVCYGFMYVLVAAYGGSRDTWIELDSKISDILYYSFAGAAALFLGGMLYFYGNIDGIFYFTFAIACLAFAFCYSALAMSLITKR